jgi:hypothetical protein
MLIAQQRLNIRSPHQLVQKPAHDLLVQQPVTVLGECGGMPDRIVRAQANKPAEQQVVVELLVQQPLRADPVERLQQ